MHFFYPRQSWSLCTLSFFVAVHKRQKMLRNGELGQTCNGRNQQSAFLRDLKTIRMLLIIVGAFTFCWGPNFIYLLLKYYNPYFIDMHGWSVSDWRRIIITESIVFALPYFNSRCNPIIYACMDETYRKAFKNLFQQMMCRSSSRRQQAPEAIELRPLRTR